MIQEERNQELYSLAKKLSELADKEPIFDTRTLLRGAASLLYTASHSTVSGNSEIIKAALKIVENRLNGHCYSANYC